MIAVVYTDAFQLVVMSLGALFAVPLALRQVGGFGELLTLVESAHPLVFTWETMPATLLLTMGLSFFLGGIATPEKLIRLYAMKDMPTIRRGILFAIIMILSLNSLVFILALCAIVLFPELPTGDLAMPVMATAVLRVTLGASSCSSSSYLFTALMAAAFVMPVVGGVVWRRATKQGAAASMVGGVVATFHVGDLRQCVRRARGLGLPRVVGAVRRREPTDRAASETRIGAVLRRLTPVATRARVRAPQPVPE